MTEDIDGDNVTASIVWYKNGTVETSQTNATVPASATLCDEEWYAVVTPNDGTGDGESYTSNSVVICGANTAPVWAWTCLLYTSPSPRDKRQSRMPSSA